MFHSKTQIMYLFNFEKLEVWKKSRTLAKEVYLTTKEFPDEEKYGLVSQLRRAIISVWSNVSEGASRSSKKDQKHFYEIAFSSLMETMNQLIISHDLDYISSDKLDAFRKKIELNSYMLLKLRDSTTKTL